MQQFHEDDARTGQKPQEDKYHLAKPEKGSVYEFFPQQYT